LSTTTTEIVVAFQPGRRRRTDRTAKATLCRQPIRVARQLALAHALQLRIDSGEFRNQAELARGLGFSRERISKILDLLLLAPAIQEEMLFLEGAPGKQRLSEIDLHDILKRVSWGEQLASWAALRLRP